MDLASYSGSETPSSPLRPRVLAVDDQPDALRLLQLRLQSAGMECFTSVNGEGALQVLEKQLVDVIILDVMMPQMDGFEVCRRLKASELTRDIPVIFLTARLEKGDRLKGLELGGHDYLNKPVDHQELLARTRAAIRVKQLQDQLKEKLQLQREINQLHQERLSEHWEKTLGQLAASLAHEINNPLAAALGSVQLLSLESNLSEEMHRRLHTVEQSLTRAGQKLRSLLLIAQVGRQMQEVPVAQLAADLATLTNYQAVVQKVRVITEVAQAVGWYGLPTELARAALYVMNNAIEAASGNPQAMVRLRVEARQEKACLSVADNGPGIPEAVRERLFEPFFTTKEPPHNGVGLYLASEIVKAAGGHIEVASPAGEMATEFRLCLPVQPLRSGIVERAEG